MITELNFVIKHSLSGRLRVVSRALVSNKELTHGMKLHLLNGRGITHVVANHHNGSITIYYDPEIVGEDVLFDMLGNVTWEKLAKLNGQPPKSGRERGVWKLAGKFFGGVGIVGIFIPLLPALPLLLLAAFCEEKADGSTT